MVGEWGDGCNSRLYVQAVLSLSLMFIWSLDVFLPKWTRDRGFQCMFRTFRPL